MIHLTQNLFHDIDHQPKSEVTSECSLILVSHLNEMKLYIMMLYKTQCPQPIMCLLYPRCRKKKKKPLFSQCVTFNFILVEMSKPVEGRWFFFSGLVKPHQSRNWLYEILEGLV